MSQPPNQPPSSAPGPSPEDFGPWPPAPYGWRPVSFQEAIRNKVLAPGIAMIVLGGFGVVTSLLWGVGGPFFFTLFPPKETHPLEANVFIWFSIILGCLALILSVGIVLGGIAMVRFRSWKLAMTGAILALLSFCPLGVFGLGVGIWALVILTQADVRAAFQAAQNEAAGNTSALSQQTRTEPAAPDSETGQTNTGTAES